MRRDNPEAQQRAAGEVRLEAQQVADEQRRIAGEASRLAKGADPANSDAWRRLSGEKDKLADRVDALQRTAEQVAGADKPSPQGQAGPAAAAAKELARQQIAGRMRETARQMREAAGADGAAGRAAKPAPRTGTAETEQQIARALDQIVDRLGGTADAEDLSRELEQARAMRERLDRLERQVREADARNSAGRQGQGRATGSRAGEGTSASPNPADDAQRLREQYAKELQGARESLSRLERGSPGSALGGTTPEQHEWSAVDKGTEAFKQDFSKWESLRKDVDSALERYEASVIARAARKSQQDRLNAGGSDRVPDDYRRLIARYYESLARKK